MVRNDFHDRSHFASSACLGLMTAVALVLAGCGDEPVMTGEVHKPEDVLDSSDWEVFERVIKQLPDPKLKELPDIRPPLPQWQAARTLPVDELAAEERQTLTKAWEPAKLARALSRNRAVAQCLRQERMSPEQLAGLALTIGAAMQRAQLPEDFPFDDLIRRGDEALENLLEDHRVYAALSIEDRHRVLDEAVWLHRVDRAKRLQTIPPENVALVKAHAAWLEEVMPKDFAADPFKNLVDVLEEQGVPFIELPESGSDAGIEWSRADAIVGP